MRGEEGDLGMSNTFMAVDLGEKKHVRNVHFHLPVSVFFSTLLLCLI
jgi:hypothetical protein